MAARRLSLSLIALLLLAFCAGCVKMRTTITTDGRIRRAVQCQVAKDHQESARIELQRAFPRSAGWSLREDDLGTAVRFRATSRATKPADDPFSGSATVTRTDQGMSTQYEYSETLTDKSVLKEGDRPYVASVRLEYAVTMPGRIVTQNATPKTRPHAEETDAEESDAPKRPVIETPPEPQGGTVVWQLTMAELAAGDVELSVISVKHNAKFAVVVVIGTVVALFAIYGISVWLAVRRRRRTEQAPLSEDAGAATPIAVGEEADDPIGHLPASSLGPPEVDA